VKNVRALQPAFAVMMLKSFVADLTERFISVRSFHESVFLFTTHCSRLSLSTRFFCESILFVRLEALRGSERRVVRIVGMVGLH